MFDAKLTKSSMIQYPLNQGARYEAWFFTFQGKTIQIQCRVVVCLFDLPDFLQEKQGMRYRTDGDHLQRIHLS